MMRLVPPRAGLDSRRSVYSLYLLALPRALGGAYGIGEPASAPGRSAKGVMGMRVGSGCHGRTPAEPATDRPQAARISKGTSTIAAITRVLRRRRSASIVISCKGGASLRGGEGGS